MRVPQTIGTVAVSLAILLPSLARGGGNPTSTCAIAHRSSGWFAGARVRHFGKAALIEDGSVESDPTTLVNVEAGYHITNNIQLSAALSTCSTAAKTTSRTCTTRSCPPRRNR